MHSSSPAGEPRRVPRIADGYPGDCATSIQQCVDLASDGYTIYVNADDAGPGFSVYSKSIEVSSGNGTKYHTGYIAVGDGATPVHVRVSGFNVTQFVHATFDSSTGSSMTVQNVTVTAGAGYAAAIAFYAEDSTSSFSLERSSALATGVQQPALKLAAFGNGANATFHVVGNQFSGHGDTSSGAGIYLQMYDDAIVKADILNNTIWDVAHCSCGGASGIEVLANDTVHADVNIVGNSVERAGSAGILVSNSVAAGALLALDLFNNIFAHARGAGIWLIAGAPATMAFRGGYNDTFGNGSANVYDGLPKGPGNLNVAPKFVNATIGDLRLKSASGLIDKGQVCSPGGVANPDAAGKTRLSGMSVDMGALERGAAAISGAVVLGTDGPDSLLGTGGNDIVCGYEGADTLHGYEGRRLHRRRRGRRLAVG